MIGGYIFATTAFVVVNEYFPSFYNCLIPGIIGGFIIGYWMKKTKRKNSLEHQ
jgi:fructose-specific phosphotransferase system IIC component